MNVAAKVACVDGGAAGRGAADIALPERPGPARKASRWFSELLWMALFVPAMIAALPFLLLMALVVAWMDPRGDAN
jgi:hypothetical protein